MDNQPTQSSAPGNGGVVPGPDKPTVSQQPFTDSEAPLPITPEPAPPAQPVVPPVDPAPAQPVHPAPPLPNSASSKRRQRLIALLSLAVTVILIVIVTALVNRHVTHNKKIAQAHASSQSRAAQLRSKRNAERQTDILSLQTFIEAYFSQSGYYPSSSDINSTDWRSANMKDLDPATLVDPLSSCDPANAECLLTKPAPKVYSYEVTDGQGQDCENDDTTCAQYTLTATYEGTVNGATTFIKNNLD